MVMLALPAGAAPTFPPLTGRVVDNARILSAEGTQALSAKLEAFEAATGHQVVVVTLPTLQGYEIEDYGYQLGRAWQIGQKGKDDGVLLIIAPNERKVRVEVGYGLEPVLTDALSSTIIQTAILPAFKAGKMEAGVVAGTEAIVQQLSLPDDQAKAIAAQPVQRSSNFEFSGSPLIFYILFGLWLVPILLRGFGRLLGGRHSRFRGREDSSLWWLLPLFFSGSSDRGSGGGSWGGGGGFSGGGGSFGGGGSSGGW
jgi:uncharacterized protein